MGGAKVTVAVLCRILLALALLRSAFAHLSNQYAFLGSIYGYEIVSPVVGVVIAEFLPFWNATLAVALLLRFELRTTFSTVAATFLVFLLAQGSVLARGKNVPCGCFGMHSTTPIGWTTLSIAGTGLILAFVGWWTARENRLTRPVEA